MGSEMCIRDSTVVAFGTSSPEFIVSFISAIKKIDDIAIGNIIGSNIANIGLILGVSSLIYPIKIKKASFKIEIPVMIASVVILFLLSIDGKISVSDGLILMSCIIIFIFTLVFISIKRHREEMNGITQRIRVESNTRKEKGRVLNVIFVLLGISGLVLGSNITINSSVKIAEALGIKNLIIGISLVAVGTSLPELATSVVSSLKKKSDICFGNAIGSNIFNIFFVLGAVSIIKPLDMDLSVLKFEFPVMFLFSIILIPMMISGMIIKRLEGFILLAGYAVFIALLFR